MALKTHLTKVTIWQLTQISHHYCMPETNIIIYTPVKKNILTKDKEETYKLEEK